MICTFGDVTDVTWWRELQLPVRSIVGRYLEHSRIFYFGAGAEEPQFLIGSADWMPRNLDRRIEVLAPVSHPKHQAWLEHVLELDLADDIVRWEMDGDGSRRPKRKTAPAAPSP